MHGRWFDTEKRSKMGRIRNGQETSRCVRGKRSVDQPHGPWRRSRTLANKKARFVALSSLLESAKKIGGPTTRNDAGVRVGLNSRWSGCVWILPLLSVEMSRKMLHSTAWLIELRGVKGFV